MAIAVNYCKNGTNIVCKSKEEIDFYIGKVNWFVGVNDNIVDKSIFLKDSDPHFTARGDEYFPLHKTIY